MVFVLVDLFLEIAATDADLAIGRAQQLGDAATVNRECGANGVHCQLNRAI